LDNLVSEAYAEYKALPRLEGILIIQLTFSLETSSCPFNNGLSRMSAKRGVNVNANDLSTQLADYTDASLGNFFKDAAFSAYDKNGTGSFNMSMLNDPNENEHDLSLSRLDTSQGNNWEFNVEKFKKFIPYGTLFSNRGLVKKDSASGEYGLPLLSLIQWRKAVEAMANESTIYGFDFIN
jgi:hypothetical protein